MATNRLTFLYPHLCRTGRWSEQVHTIARKQRRPSTSTLPSLRCQHAAPYTTPSSGRQAPFNKRHGKAVEPISAAENPTPNSTESTLASNSDSNQTAQTSPQAGDQGAAEEDTKGPAAESVTADAAGSGIGDTKTPPIGPEETAANTNNSNGTLELSAETQSPASGTASEANTAEPPSEASMGPLDTILQMKPPPSLTSDQQPPTRGDSRSDPPPHLSPAPYVHHFDTYSLVKELTNGGYTLNQSIEIMKAVRQRLAANLDVAQDSLVSKSDVENETYLFRAACSELKAELVNRRRLADAATRTDRTLLQREVDTLSQLLKQDTATLKESVKGMFNDRHMEVRQEEKARDSQIQKINLKATNVLASGAKSEIESLRWILIRRSSLGLLILAFLSISALNYASHVSKERKKAADLAALERAREAEEAKRLAGRQDHATGPEAMQIMTAG